MPTEFFDRFSASFALPHKNIKPYVYQWFGLSCVLLCVCELVLHTHIRVDFSLQFFLFSSTFFTLFLLSIPFGTDRLIPTKAIHSLWIRSVLLFVVITIRLILFALSFLFSSILLFDARAALAQILSLTLFPLWVFLCVYALTFIESLYPSLATEVKFS